MVYKRDESGRFTKGTEPFFKSNKMPYHIKRKISISMKGRHNSPFTQFKKNYKPWNKGISCWSEEIRKQQSFSNKGKHFSPTTEFKKNDPRLIGNKINLGRKLLEETKLKIGKALKGRKAWNKGKKLKPEIIKKILQRRIPSSLEKKFISIVEKFNLPYKFVGNGSFWVENKNPDFININGRKIAIEVYYRKHKEIFGQAKGKSIEQWKQERQEIFNRYGWELIFFDEVEVNDKTILKRLGVSV